MYPVQWDEETGGVLLTDSAEGAMDGEVRPVFFEELDLLGFDKSWTYERTEAPLLWARGRRYYYRGEWVAEAKGGGFFEAPQIVLQRRELCLEPVDVEAMERKNAPLMEGLVFRAIEFIRREYERRRRRVDAVAVAFSGGKDSLTTLDLVQRALPPDEFVVVFADTTMELSATYEAVERAKAHWPNLCFYTARSHLNAQESWRLFGPPSRIHRWCCSVHKTAPTMLKLREIVGERAVDALVFDGCRRAESQARFRYTPVSAGCKHATQVNVSPILDWGSAEVFLYLSSRSLALNRGYRRGFVRMGCVVCPLASPWWDALAWMMARESAQPFVDMLLDLGRSMSVPEDEVADFVTSGGWRGRAGGRSLTQGGNKVLITETNEQMILRLRNPKEDWLQWAKVLGSVSQEGEDTGRILSARGSNVYPFRFVRHGDALEISVSGLEAADRFLRRDLRAIGYKAAYCVHCRTCEVECPTGTLHIDGVVKIDERTCINCGNCLGFVRKGCWVARSLSVSEEATPMKLKTYQHFGMRKKWLDEFFSDPEGWWRENSLGPCQFDAMKAWLADGELSVANKISELGKALSRLGGTDSPLTWFVIWCNLARNSSLINWYVTQVPWHRSYSREELVELLPERLSRSTRENGVRALIGLLRDTPLGSDLGMGRVEGDGSGTKAVIKEGARQAPALAILYSLYRYAESQGRYNLSLAELSSGAPEGPVAVFGVRPEQLQKHLRGLSSQYSDWIKVELVRDLDNIFLEPSYRAEGVVSLA
jgi:phosphoadenosine phosphosulfate reductase